MGAAPHAQTIRNRLLLLGIAAALFVIALVLPFDGPLMEYLRPFSFGRSVVVRLTTELGHSLTHIALFLILIALYEEYKTGLAGLSSILATGICVVLLKDIIGLAGPQSLRPSFPSGHTAAAFVVASVLANRYPKSKYLFFILALAVGISRVLLRKHYPSDVCAGAALGLAVGVVANWLWGRMSISFNLKALQTAAFALLPPLFLYAALGSDVPQYHMKITVPAIVFLLIRKWAGDRGNAQADE
jgi:membrane-associated phospholipid phosphatase